MWVFVIPLYSPAVAMDAAVFNLVEFWTGAALSFGDEKETGGSKPIALGPPGGAERPFLTISQE
jgi:hypothetical protein